MKITRVTESTAHKGLYYLQGHLAVVAKKVINVKMLIKQGGNFNAKKFNCLGKWCDNTHAPNVVVN